MAGKDLVKELLGFESALTDTGIDPSAQQAYDQLNAFLATLSDKQFQQVQKAVELSAPPLNTTGLLGIQSGDIRALADTVQSALGSSAQVPGSSQQQQSQQARTGTPNTGAAAPSPSPSSSGASSPTPAAGQGPPSLAGGTLYTPQAYDLYAGEIAGSGATNIDALAAMSGLTTQEFQSEYQAYQQNMNAVRGELTSTMILSPVDYASMKAKAVQGQWQPLLDALDQQFQQEYGQPMPGDLRMQLLTALQQLPQQEIRPLLAAEYQYVTQMHNATQQQRDTPGVMAGYLSTMLQYVPSSIGGVTAGGVSGTTGIIGQYISTHPEIGMANTQAAQKGAENTAAINMLTQYGITPTSDLLKAITAHGDWQSELGVYLQWMADRQMPISADTITQLLGMPFGDPNSATVQSGTGGAFLQSQPSDVKGLTWGQKQTVSSNMTGMWQQYFSRNPNNQELLWGLGKTPTELQDFVNNSPSSVPGVNIGRYNDYVNFIQGLSTSGATTHAFSMGVDDSLVQSLHQHLTSQQTQQAQPGPLTPQGATAQ